MTDSRTYHLLAPNHLLVNEVTQWLAQQTRSGVAQTRTLDHLLVLVSTRQAGRRLRLALAQSLGACVPPRIMLPEKFLVAPATPGTQPATEAECLSLLSQLLGTIDLTPFSALFPESSHANQSDFRWRLAMARQLQDIWRLLQENALTMRDVVLFINTHQPQLAFLPDHETERWTHLAQLEELFFQWLATHNRCHPATARQQAVKHPNLPAGVEEIVLPGVLDLQPAVYQALANLTDQQPTHAPRLTILIHAAPEERDQYDDWGRPLPAFWSSNPALKIPLREDQYHQTTTSAQQAQRIAEIVSHTLASGFDPPGVGMVDDSLFLELQAAFLEKNLNLHNPAHLPLSQASLGQLVVRTARLCNTPSYAVFAAWFRQADVLRYLEATLPNSTNPKIAQTLLHELDEVYRKHLPQTFADLHRFCNETEDYPTLRDAVSHMATWLEPNGRSPTAQIREILSKIFSARTLYEKLPGDRELQAAANCLNSVLDATENDFVRQILPNDRDRTQLFESLLAEASYALEPNDPDTLVTDGWLELAWHPAQELVISGMNESSVPQSVVGHAFLPDRLRKSLGMTDNEQRTARDICLFNNLLRSREPGAVTLFLERMDNQGNVRKPSRLLLLCGHDNPTFAARVLALYREADKPTTGYKRTLPPAWRLKLPIPATPPPSTDHPRFTPPSPTDWPLIQLPNRLGITAFKDYLQCPFSFFLKHILKMKPCDDQTHELEATDFGVLCHELLQSFARSNLRDSPDAAQIEDFLITQLDLVMTRRFGSSRSTVLRMQENSLYHRLAFFAKEQARLASDGWRILATELPCELTLCGVTITGRIDRIDYCTHTQVCRLLDYKTWNKKADLESFSTSKKKRIEQTRAQGFSTCDFIESKKDRIWTDLQLPLYHRLATTKKDLIPTNAKLMCGYFVLAETETDTTCQVWDFDAWQDAAEAKAKQVIEHIKAGLFWPITALNPDFTMLFPDPPEKGIALPWLDDQHRRLLASGVVIPHVKTDFTTLQGQAE